MSKLAEQVREEVRALFPPTLFFFIALHLVALFRALMLKGSGIALVTSASVTLAALILGKSVLIADHLRIINLYPHKPLIYNISWKTLIYFLLAMGIHYLERLSEFWRTAGGFVAANDRMLAELIWPHFWAIQMLLLLLIFMYCTMRELVRVIGAAEVRRIFFG